MQSNRKRETRQQLLRPFYCSQHFSIFNTFGQESPSVFNCEVDKLVYMLLNIVLLNEKEITKKISIFFNIS